MSHNSHSPHTRVQTSRSLSFSHTLQFLSLFSSLSPSVSPLAQRARQLEFLQATANPIDMQIVGPKGRAAVLRSVSSNMGMDGDEIVPSEDALNQMQQQAAQAAQAQGVPGHGGMGEQAAQAQGGQRVSPVNGNQGPVTAIAGGPQ